jgi:23S rRNA pseudouridine1911/1915/1917 synthase
MARRHFLIGAPESGRTLVNVLRARHSLSWSDARRLVRERRVCLDGQPCTDPTRRVRQGQRLELREPGPKADRQGTPEPGQPVVRHVDDQLVVVEKPAGLTTMRHAEEEAEFGPRGRRYLPPTLADLLPALLGRGRRGRQPRVRAVHRLDKDTSGLVVFARTVEAERALGAQFRDHTIERRYLAVVRGRARSGRIESFLVRDRGDGRRGSSPNPREGKRAVTHVRVVEELRDYTLVECRLETGRTHQVRIHLGESGTPICGERVYDRPLHGRPVPDHSGAPRLALHACSLGFTHPKTGKPVEWYSPWPADLASFVGRLRRKAKHGLG